MPLLFFVSRSIVQLLNRSVAVAYACGGAQPSNRSDATAVPERRLLALDPRLHGLAPLPRDARAVGARARRVRPSPCGRGERGRAAERAGRAAAHLPELDGRDRRPTRAARAARAHASRSRPPGAAPPPDRRREKAPQTGGTEGAAVRPPGDRSTDGSGAATAARAPAAGRRRPRPAAGSGARRAARDPLAAVYLKLRPLDAVGDE